MHRVIRPIKYACVALDGHLVDISLPFIALCITKFRRHGYLMNQNREHGFQQWRKINGCEEEWVGQGSLITTCPGSKVQCCCGLSLLAQD